MGDFSQIYPSNQELTDIMPERVYIVAAKADMGLYFGSRSDDGHISSLAFFMPDPLKASHVRFCFIYTDWRISGQGVSKELFKYCLNYFKSKGIRVVSGHYEAHAEETKDIIEYGNKALGFNFADVDNILLKYNLFQLYASGALDTVIDSGKSDKIASRISDKKDSGLKLFYVTEYEGSSLTMDDLTSEYSRYYMKNGKIHGAIVARRADEALLQILDIKLDETAMKDNVYLFLFASCMEEAKNQLGESAAVYINIAASSRIYDGLLDAFNPPEEEYVVLDYIREIG